MREKIQDEAVNCCRAANPQEREYNGGKRRGEERRREGWKGEKRVDEKASEEDRQEGSSGEVPYGRMTHIIPQGVEGQFQTALLID